MTKKFSIRKRIKSFKYAFRGLFYLLRKEHNAWIHTAAAIIVVAAGLYFKLRKMEWVLIAIAIGFVFSAEAINSAIERLTNIVSPNYDKKAGHVKDLAAAGVLIAAFTALAIGVVVFLPRIIRLFR
jgi:diacylglycerol kinase (ATP)